MEKIKVKLSFTAVLVLMISCLMITSCGKENNDKTENDKNKSESQSTAEVQKLKNADKFTVHYDVKGMMNGKMDIMRDGNKLKQVINTNVMGLNTINTIYILDNVAYSVTDAAGQKFATKSDIKEYNLKKNSGETIVDFKEFEDFLSKKTVTGKENVLGYECDVYDVGGGLSMSVYDKKYVLKINNPQFMATATGIDVQPNFAANEFTLPPDIDFNNPGKKGMDKKAVDSLLKHVIPKELEKNMPNELKKKLPPDAQEKIQKEIEKNLQKK